MRLNRLKVLLLALSLSLSAPTFAAEDDWESWNRRVHSFNLMLDSAVARPVAQGYRYLTPRIIRSGVGNFFDNLDEVPSAVNHLLQAKPAGALKSSGRFVINSSIGLLGLIDVASWLGVKEHKEDLGQTLAVWGVGSGPYIVLPVLGPSTMRDALSIYPNYQLNPLESGVVTEEERYQLLALDLVHRRHKLLDKEDLVTGDSYVFYRDAYLQSRDYDIKDGAVEDDFDAGFDDLDDIDFDEAF